MKSLSQFIMESAYDFYTDVKVIDNSDCTFVRAYDDKSRDIVLAAYPKKDNFVIDADVLSDADLVFRIYVFSNGFNRIRIVQKGNFSRDVIESLYYDAHRIKTFEIVKSDWNLEDFRIYGLDIKEDNAAMHVDGDIDTDAWHHNMIDVMQAYNDYTRNKTPHDISKVIISTDLDVKEFLTNVDTDITASLAAYSIQSQYGKHGGARLDPVIKFISSGNIAEPIQSGIDLVDIMNQHGLNLKDGWYEDDIAKVTTKKSSRFWLAHLVFSTNSNELHVELGKPKANAIYLHDDKTRYENTLQHV